MGNVGIFFAYHEAVRPNSKNMLFLILSAVCATFIGLADQPEIRITVFPAETGSIGSQIEIQYTLSGIASEDDRVMLPPVWQKTNGLEFLGWEQRVSSTRNSKEVTWIAKIRVLDAGPLTVPSLEFRTYAAGDLPAGIVSLAGASPLTVTAAPVTIYGRNPGKISVLAGLIVLIGLLAGGLAGYGVYRRRSQARKHEDTGLSSIQERWHQARRLRLDGDAYGALKALLALCGEAGGPRELIDALDAAARDAGFRGKIPDPDTFESLFRRVEKVIQERMAGADHAPKPTGSPE